MLGMYISNMLNVAAAVKAINKISSKFKDLLGIAYAAKATIKPSTKYLISLLVSSFKSTKSVNLSSIINNDEKKIYIYIKYLLKYIYYSKNIMSNFIKKKLSDGSKNPKYIDLLTEDKPITGQKFTCISFISPEKILKQKNQFLFNEFIKQYDFEQGIKKYTQFLNFISFKYELNFEDLTSDLQEFLKTEKNKLKNSNIYDDYKTFLDNNEDKLTDEFNIENDFRTNTRGLKVRGSYSTQQEAELRCKLLREVDPNHNIMVGPVGVWMPWDPDAYKTGKVEYLEDELNQLMSEKDKNEKHAKLEFEKRILKSKQDAIENNKKMAKQSGNKLTQNIDNDGNLIGVNNTIENNFMSSNETISSADIRKELFDKNNVRTKLTDSKK